MASKQKLRERVARKLLSAEESGRIHEERNKVLDRNLPDTRKEGEKNEREQRYGTDWRPLTHIDLDHIENTIGARRRRTPDTNRAGRNNEALNKFRMGMSRGKVVRETDPDPKWDEKRARVSPRDSNKIMRDYKDEIEWRGLRQMHKDRHYAFYKKHSTTAQLKDNAVQPPVFTGKNDKDGERTKYKMKKVPSQHDKPKKLGYKT